MSSPELRMTLFVIADHTPVFEVEFERFLNQKGFNLRWYTTIPILANALKELSLKDRAKCGVLIGPSIDGHYHEIVHVLKAMLVPEEHMVAWIEKEPLLELTVRLAPTLRRLEQLSGSDVYLGFA